MHTPSIITQNILVKQKLSTLVEMLLSNGALIDKNLQIHYDTDGLSIHCVDDALHVKKRIEIPNKIIPRLNNFHFDIKAENLTCTPKMPMNPLDEKIMSLMIDIFNLTHKIATHKNSNIFYNLKDHRDFLSLLLSPLQSATIDNYLNLLDKGELTNLLLHTFLGTRKFNLEDNDTLEPVLIPLIDYLNHKVTTQGYQSDKNKMSTYVETSLTHEKETQLFVSYNYFDALEALIYYGFADTSTPLLFSIPMTITINDTLTLEIKNTNFRKFTNEKISEILLPIKEIIPNIKKEDTKITISKLVIPSVQLPYALRQILHLVLNEIGIENSQDIRLSMIERIEKQLIANNLTHFINLQSKLNVIIQEDTLNSYTKEQLHTLIQHNIKHLKDYGRWFKN